MLLSFGADVVLRNVYGREVLGRWLARANEVMCRLPLSKPYQSLAERSALHACPDLHCVHPSEYELTLSASNFLRSASLTLFIAFRQTGYVTSPSIPLERLGLRALGLSDNARDGRVHRPTRRRCRPVRASGLTDGDLHI
jgi:hypothetical protein